MYTLVCVIRKYSKEVRNSTPGINVWASAWVYNISVILPNNLHIDEWHPKEEVLQDSMKFCHYLTSTLAPRKFHLEFGKLCKVKHTFHDTE